MPTQNRFTPNKKNMDSVNGRPARPPKIIISDRPLTKPASLNLLTQKSKTSGPKRILKKIVTVAIVAILAFSGFILWRANNISSKIFVGQKTTFFGRIVSLIRGSSTTLLGENLGQVNVLLLGIGGEGHDGPYLTDTMILAQIRPDTQEVVLTSIPRDYLVTLPGGNDGKINQSFSDGYIKNHDWNAGGEAARQIVEKISGLTIPYFAVMDFSGFEKAVNQIGGVDVTVDRTFTDYTYPNSGIGYLPPITFTQGPEHMDGTRALEFARSRHAAGPEGSDFARGQRQQKIIEAFKQKVIGTNLVSDASTINVLMGTFADHFHTNISPSEVFRLYSLVQKKDIHNFLSLSLDPDTGLICPEILESTGAYVLTPCPGKSVSDVVNYFKNSFSIGKLVGEKSIVWLASSTGDRKAYNTAFRKLTDAGIAVYELSYSKDNLPETVVYQVNPKPATTEFITNELLATPVTLPPPGVHIPQDKVDVIVVLGANAPVEPEPAPYIAPPARKATTTEPSLSTSTPQTTNQVFATSTPAISPTPLSTPTATSTTKKSIKLPN